MNRHWLIFSIFTLTCETMGDGEEPYPETTLQWQRLPVYQLQEWHCDHNKRKKELGHRGSVRVNTDTGSFLASFLGA